MVFVRQRPGRNERCPALAGAGISREQLRINVRDDSLLVHRVGRCVTVVDGEPVDEWATLGAGKTLLLEKAVFTKKHEAALR